jgi:predicted PurR-regulated permease PerM
VGLSAIAVLLAILVGAELLGLTGVLLAVPTAAVLKILWHRLTDRYRRSSFYTGDDDGAAAPTEPSQDSTRRA